MNCTLGQTTQAVKLSRIGFTEYAHAKPLTCPAWRPDDDAPVGLKATGDDPFQLKHNYTHLFKNRPTKGRLIVYIPCMIICVTMLELCVMFTHYVFIISDQWYHGQP